MAGPALDLIDSGEDVRIAVGASPIDVTDTIVQSLMIGYLAEVKVKARVPYWATVMDGSRYAPDDAKTEAQRVRLRAAAVYYAAGLVARRVESGAIPLVSGGQQTPVDWKLKATEMFAMYGALISELAAADPAGGTPDVPLPAASFSMARSPRGHANDWMTDPPIARILHPLAGEDWS